MFTITGRQDNMADGAFALSTYSRALDYVRTAGLLEEVEGQRHASFDDCDESDFLREFAWVIFCSGFRESTVRRVFDYLSLCFCDFRSATEIVFSAEQCRATALSAFNNPAKVDAVIETASLIAKESYQALKLRVSFDPIATLQSFPFIGKITSYHLAKNLGFQLAKPDRHLVRICERAGFDDVQQLCHYISVTSGDPINVVDIVLWRFAADRRWPDS